MVGEEGRGRTCRKKMISVAAAALLILGLFVSYICISL
jgi:hypothetical protein